ncbi:MAG: hypothetical protein ACM31C_14840 [Acidobacteriota bacterium]
MRRLVVLAGLLASQGARADKSRDTAEILSGAGAGVSTAIVLSSFLATDRASDTNMPLLYAGLGTSLVTPSLGELYAGQYLTWGMGVRALAGAAAIYAVTAQTETVTCTDQPTATVKCQNMTSTGLAILGLAAITYIGGAWYDIADAPDAVDRKSGRIRVAPIIVPAGDGSWAPGLYFSAAY